MQFVLYLPWAIEFKAQGGFKVVRMADRITSRYDPAMTNQAISPVQFLTSLLHAVRDVTGQRQPPAWTHVSKVQQKLATDNVDAVDAAIRLAVKKGWLRADGDPASSITITVEGVKFLQT